MIYLYINVLFKSILLIKPWEKVFKNSFIINPFSKYSLDILFFIKKK